jgi:hypothetical protein
MVSPVLPWLAVLALLALRPNRGWSAWWIWLPLAGLAAVAQCVKPALRGLDAGLDGAFLDLLADGLTALPLGLAALWLLAPYLGSRRIPALLGSALLMVGFSGFSFAATAGWTVGLQSIEGLIDPRHCADTALSGELALPFFVPLTLMAFVLAAALTLAGLACRGRYRPGWLCLWLPLSLLFSWLGGSLLVHKWCGLAATGGMPLLAWATPFIVMALWATLLPFQILSAANPLFRERFKSLLHAAPLSPPMKS